MDDQETGRSDSSYTSVKVGPMTGKVLVVDDQAMIRKTVCSYLERKGVETVQADDAEKAMPWLWDPGIFLVITDMVMPGASGLELLRKVRQERPDLAVVLMTGHTELPTAEKALCEGAFFFLMKPFFMETVLLLCHRAWEAKQLRQAYHRLQNMTNKEHVLSTMTSLAAAIDAKSTYTHDHSERVACIARRLARSLDLPQEEVDQVYAGALVHDVGKVGIPDSILNLEGKLTPKQRAQIEQHPEIGERILAPIKAAEPLLKLVRHHHENWDGTGYPDGKAGEEIPLFARIVKVADTFDAVTSARPYRTRTFTTQEALEMLIQGRGSQFDPRIVDIFILLMDVHQLMPVGTKNS